MFGSLRATAFKIYIGRFFCSLFTNKSRVWKKLGNFTEQAMKLFTEIKRDTYQDVMKNYQYF